MMTIRSEIESRLAAVAVTLSLPVAYENITFIKPVDGNFLEIFFLTSTSLNRNVSASGYRTRGIFQINCYCPLNIGLGGLDATVDAIIAAFPVLPKIGTVSIDEPLSDGPALIVDASVMIPVTGRYRVEV
jgi:hypothetical protein